MLSKMPVRWGTIVITLSDSFKGNPRQTFKLLINCMASKICLSNDILLNSCSTPRSFLRSTLYSCEFTLRVMFDRVFCVTLRSLWSTQLLWQIKLIWSDPSLMECQPFGSSKEEVLREVETLSVLWMHCRFKYAGCLLPFGPRCTRRTCLENNSFIKQPRVQRVKSLLKFSFSSFECFKMSFTNTSPSSAYS